MPKWKLTHVLWYRKKPFYVMEVATRRPGAPTAMERTAMEADAAVDEPSPEERTAYARRNKLGTVDDAVYYRWDGVCQWTRRARTHYFLGVRVSPIEFLRAAPTAEETVLYAPRERPPHPFEEGITERPADEVGEPFYDRTEEPQLEGPDIGRYREMDDGQFLVQSHDKVKMGLQFVELQEAEEAHRGEQEPAPRDPRDGSP